MRIMRCRTCDYPLWNLKTRACPECGATFSPAQFEFVPGAVKFCCPHCDQPYYGTTETGHLFPSQFACVNCDRPVDMDEMVLRPEGDLDDVDTRPGRMPWLERKERGRFAGWIGTVGMSLVRPLALMRGLPPNASTWQAWWFATITATVTTAIMMLPLFVLMALPMLAMAGGPARALGLRDPIGLDVHAAGVDRGQGRRHGGVARARRLPVLRDGAECDPEQRRIAAAAGSLGGYPRHARDGTMTRRVR